MQVPNFKPVSPSDFQIDFPKNIGGLIKITKINIKLTFNEYEFLRVKNTTGSSAAIYTKPEWVGKEVSIIPMKLNVTDRYIETCYNEETQQYELEAETDVIFKKTINAGKNVGRAYLPKDLIGLDVLLIKTPEIENLY